MATESVSVQYAAARPAPVGNVWPVIFGAGIGNVLEWYDFAAYAIFAPFFAPQFFSPTDKTAALLSALAVFAVGFLLRPLGGLYYGRLADRKGRRYAMVVSMCVTAAGCLVIAISPTYAVIGTVAPILLVVGRLAQGFGLGGEIGASYTFLVESAPPNHRGLWASSMFIALIMGSLLATIVALVLNAALPAGALQAYAWRIPFLLGALLGVYAIFLRKELVEPEAFKKAATDGETARRSIWKSIYENKSAVLMVIGLTAGPTVSYNTWVSGATSYSINFKHMPASGALWALLIACVVYIVVQPFWGSVSDHVGRKPNLFLGAGAGAILAYPMVNLIQGEFWQLAVAMSVSMFVLAAWTSICPAVYAELFPTHIRATATAIPYSLAVALFGGTAPYLQNWLASIDRMDIFSGYLALLNLLTVATILVMPETRGRPLT